MIPTNRIPQSFRTPPAQPGWQLKDGTFTNPEYPFTMRPVPPIKNYEVREYPTDWPQRVAELLDTDEVIDLGDILRDDCGDEG